MHKRMRLPDAHYLSDSSTCTTAGSTRSSDSTRRLLTWTNYRSGRGSRAPAPRPGTIVVGPTGKNGKVVVEMLAGDRGSFSRETKFASDRIGDDYEDASLDCCLLQLKRAQGASTSGSSNSSNPGGSPPEGLGVNKLGFDIIDLDKIKHLGSLRAAAFIEMMPSTLDELPFGEHDT